ncbi:RloB family protein [Persephonella sp.]|uniref:RloB family protein n=1 Tax=Persephonella sp. TaxID=2060922 RepID=UPI00262582A7|nr:RloB family protein [Persephonella sp.]
MARRKKKNRELKDVILVYIEGETEEEYINFLKSKFRDKINIKIEPEFPKEPQNLDRTLKEIKSKLKEVGISPIYWIIDFDHFNNDINERRRFENFWNNAKNIKDIKLLVNNPCIEFWFLLHLKYRDKSYTSCGECEEDLKKEEIILVNRKKEIKIKPFQNYKKGKFNEEIKTFLIENLYSAIENAKKLGTFDINDPKSCAEIYLLIEEKILNKGIS